MLEKENMRFFKKSLKSKNSRITKAIKKLSHQKKEMRGIAKKELKECIPESIQILMDVVNDNTAENEWRIFQKNIKSVRLGHRKDFEILRIIKGLNGKSSKERQVANSNFKDLCNSKEQKYILTAIDLMKKSEESLSRRKISLQVLGEMFLDGNQLEAQNIIPTFFFALSDGSTFDIAKRFLVQFGEKIRDNLFVELWEGNTENICKFLIETDKELNFDLDSIFDKIINSSLIHINQQEYQKKITTALSCVGLLDIKKLSTGLNANSAEMRIITANSISQMGKNGRSILPELYRTLSDDDERVRVAASLAIHKIGPNKKSINYLIAALSDSNSEVTENVISCISILGPFAIPFLLKELRKHETKSEKNTFWAILRSSGIPTRDSNDELMKKISDKGVTKIIDSLFKFIIDHPENQGGFSIRKKELRAFISISSLTKEIVDLFTDLSAYTIEREGRYVSINHEISDKALECLCAINSQLSHNILHLVENRTNFTISYPIRYTLSFNDQRLKASNELKRRGNPKYQIDIYCN